MGRIQSNIGLVTGVPIEETVNQLMQLNGLSRDRLASRNSLLQQEQIAVTELMTQVVGVQLTTDRLGQASLFSATKVSSSRPDALSVQSTGAPTPGNYSFVPVRTAQSQQLSSGLFSTKDQNVGAGEVVIHTGGFLDRSVNLDALNGGSGVARGHIRITDRSGTSQTIDLRFAQTAQDVVERINANDSLKVTARLNGNRFELTDVSGAASSDLTVEEAFGGSTAADLGLGGISTASSVAEGTEVLLLTENSSLRSLLDGRGLALSTDSPALEFQLQDGSTFSLTSELDASSATLGQLLDEINIAGGGSIEAKISSDGNRIDVQDLTSGASEFTITSPTGALAESLGLTAAASGGVIEGAQLLAGLGDVLLSSLGGGAGLGELGQISITDRGGTTATVDLTGAVTLQQVIDTINNSPAAVRASLNSTQTGLEIRDTSGAESSDLVIADADGSNSATRLQLAASTSEVSVDSGSLNFQYVTASTSLDQFTRGDGLNLGQIRLTDSDGLSATVNLAKLQPETVGDVIDKLNSLGLGLQASINHTGDGILLADTAGGSGDLTVEDVASGTAARQLGIAGIAEEIAVDGGTLEGISGSRTIRLSTDGESSVEDLVEQINALSQSPVNASLLNLGSDGAVRILLSSTQTGAQGRVAIDSDVGLSFSQTVAAKDALLSYGASDTSGGVLVSSSNNTFSGLVEDLEFTITESSATPVTVSVTENSDNIAKQIETFVDQYNGLREKLESLTVFDEESGAVGVLFGSNAALRVDVAFGRLLSGTFRGVGSVASLGQVGIRLTETGRLSFDKATFSEAIANDPEAVEEFFTNEELGFSQKAKSLADSLAGVGTGALLNTSNTLQSQIEQNAQRIESMELRLDRQRTRLLKQFYSMETAISKLQQNLTALNQLQIVPPLGS